MSSHGSAAPGRARAPRARDELRWVAVGSAWRQGPGPRTVAAGSRHPKNQGEDVTSGANRTNDARCSTSGRKHRDLDAESDSTVNEATFEGVGGLKIFYRAWRPTAAPRGVI